MAKELNKAQVNHLRRLLGWVRCSEGVFQSPEEIKATVRQIAPAIKDEITADAMRRVVESYMRAESIPKYVRAAIKALEPLVKDAEGEFVDAESRQQPRLESPKRDFWRRGLTAPK